MGDFRGSAPAKIDDRGRLKVPTDFRRALEETYGVDVFVTSIQGDSTLLYPLPIWDDIEQQLARLPRTTPPSDGSWSGSATTASRERSTRRGAS